MSAQMRRFSSPSLRPLSFRASAALALARGVFRLTADPNPPVRRVSRFPQCRNMTTISGVKGCGSGKPDRQLLIPSANRIMFFRGEHSAIIQCMQNQKNRGTTKEFIACYGDGRPAHSEGNGRSTSVGAIYDDVDAHRTTLEVMDGKGGTTGKIVNIMRCDFDSDDEVGWEWEADVDGVYPVDTIPYGGHCDGSIYTGTDPLKKTFCVADRSETRMEAMMDHVPCQMLQIFSLKLSKVPEDRGSLELYGYIAARDDLDPLLNYVVNFSRDDPITVKQGSLLSMSGLKRGIKLSDVGGTANTRIKTGEQEKDDLQLIDGVSIIDGMAKGCCKAFTYRIHGDCGAIDITASLIYCAVQATVEVLISEVRSSFNLCLGCFTSGMLNEIRLFDGVIWESRGLRRSVVAVLMDTQMDLKFKVGTDSLSIPAEHSCSFQDEYAWVFHSRDKDWFCINFIEGGMVNFA